MQYKVWLKPCVATFRETVLPPVAHIAAETVCKTVMIPRTNWLQKARVLQHIFKTIYSQSWALHETVWLKKGFEL